MLGKNHPAHLNILLYDDGVNKHSQQIELWCLSFSINCNMVILWTQHFCLPGFNGSGVWDGEEAWTSLFSLMLRKDWWCCAAWLLCKDGDLHMESKVVFVRASLSIFWWFFRNQEVIHHAGGGILTRIFQMLPRSPTHCSLIHACKIALPPHWCTAKCTAVDFSGLQWE